MVDRPDLDKLASWIKQQEEAGDYRLPHANLELLLTYCRELEAENKRLLENGAGRIRMCRKCLQPFDPHQVGQTVCQPCAESDPNYGKEAYTDKPRLQP